jgi:ATP-binding cassette subfamily B protein
VLANDDHAKEVRLLGLSPLLLARYDSLGSRLCREDDRLAMRRAGYGYVLSLLALGAYYAAHCAVAVTAACGRMSLGEMALYVTAFRQSQQSFQSALATIGGMYEHDLYMSNLFRFLAIPTREDPSRCLSGETPAPTPGHSPAGSQESGARRARPSDFRGARGTRRGIRFEEVSYRYPGQERWALDGVTLTIPPGESIALVGANGAGKTTLVKLLTRLYRPTAGSIWLDGRTLDDWPIETLRNRISVVLQDFNQYHFSARENIGLGSIDHLDSDTRIKRAIAMAGADPVIAALPRGLETPLGRWFDDGVELSGGQWQKLALARAFMREEADIVVLDEPTASLDPEAEHAVFDRFRELARGKTALLISHRLAAARSVDRILMFDQGRIVEEGSHADLLARGSSYARLFALQAEQYV